MLKPTSSTRILWITSCWRSNVSANDLSNRRFPVITSADERNEKSKQLIRSKIDEYLARAETLKTHLDQNKTAKSAVGVTGNGVAKGYATLISSLSIFSLTNFPLGKMGKKAIRIRK